jgi:uncharacterized protein YhbP (UPF0306 family)
VKKQLTPNESASGGAEVSQHEELARCDARIAFSIAETAEAVGVCRGIQWHIVRQEIRGWIRPSRF